MENIIVKGTFIGIGLFYAVLLHKIDKVGKEIEETSKKIKETRTQYGI